MGVYGGLRSARWLKTFRQAPMVTAFRNLESGQVLFSQTMHPQEFYIDQQFKWPNWQNKKPSTRKDLRRPLVVAEVPSWESAVQLYRNLVELRHRRDMFERKQARDWRRKSADGNVWFWNQYRPTYTYEAVADLVSSLEAMELTKPAILHWESLYRKGDAAHWQEINAEHRELPAHNPREQAVVLNQVRREAMERAAALQPELAALQSAKNELFQQQIAETREKKQRIHAARVRAKQAVLAERPDLAELAQRGEAVRRAMHAWKDAVRAFDPYTPRGQRGAAKQPIKLRQRALRQAKRAFRDLKRRIGAKSKKRRVPQPRVRMQL